MGTRVIFLLLFIFCVPAQAFMLGGHDVITKRAFQEFQYCIQESEGFKLHDLYLDHFNNANRWADTNLIKKWTKYGHFYNPNRHVDAKLAGLHSRETALVSVELMFDELEKLTEVDECGYFKNPGADEDIFLALGKAIHFIQDMASPPHVVPVMHPKPLSDGHIKPHDGFEMSDNISAMMPLAGTNCSYDPNQYADVKDLMVSAATETLDRVNTTKIEVQIDGVAQSVPWSNFWREREDTDNGFGDYGVFGNHFGETSFTYKDDQNNKHQVSVDQSHYDNFMKTQLEQAIRVTKYALFMTWYNRLQRHYNKTWEEIQNPPAGCE